MIRRFFRRVFCAVFNGFQSPADRILRKLDEADRLALRTASKYHAALAEQLAYPFKDEPQSMPARNALGVKKHSEWAATLWRIAHRD